MLCYYWQSLYLDSLGNEALDRLLECARSRPSSLSTVDILHMGGAVSRSVTDESAFSGRHAPYLLGVEANWENQHEDRENMAWTRTCIEAMQLFSDGSEYLNFSGFLEKGEETLRRTFGAKYKRLVDLKNKYDPTNLFRLNANIEPT